MYTYIHTYIYIRIYIYTYTYMILTYIYIQAEYLIIDEISMVSTQMFQLLYIRIIHIYIHIYVHIYTHIHTYIHDIYTCIYMYIQAECLIIDEISMVSADMFQLLSSIAKACRNSSLPFGGLQLVLCGDFFQLGPV